MCFVFRSAYFLQLDFANPALIDELLHVVHDTLVAIVKLFTIVDTVSAMFKHELPQTLFVVHVIRTFELKVLTLHFYISVALGLHFLNEIILWVVSEDLSTFVTVTV